MYRVVSIGCPLTGQIIFVSREKESEPGRYALNNLTTGARRGDRGPKFDRVRSIIAAGSLPDYSVVKSGLSMHEAKILVDHLRDLHGVTTSRHGIARPRVHQHTDPASPFLDTATIYYVYELIRPDTNEVFYVGKGSDRHQARVVRHIAQARQGKKGHKYSIIRKLLAAGLEPVERRVHENICESDALSKEIDLVASYGPGKLANEADGGQTAPTGDNHWTRKHPEKVLSGANHPWANNPELAKRRAGAMQAALEADPTKRPRGERHGMAKLSEQQVHELRRRYKEDKALGKQLAIEFDITAAQVSRILRGTVWGLPSLLSRHGNAKLTPEQLEQIKARRAAGDSYKSVAHDFGVTQNAVFCICNPGPPKTPNTTDRPGNAKLSTTQIQSMLELYRAGGVTHDQLAQRFGVSRSQVIRIFHSNGIRRRAAEYSRN